MSIESLGGGEGAVARAGTGRVGWGGVVVDGLRWVPLPPVFRYKQQSVLITQTFSFFSTAKERCHRFQSPSWRLRGGLHGLCGGGCVCVCVRVCVYVFGEGAGEEGWFAMVIACGCVCACVCVCGRC